MKEYDKRKKKSYKIKSQLYVIIPTLMETVLGLF